MVSVIPHNNICIGWIPCIRTVVRCTIYENFDDLIFFVVDTKDKIGNSFGCNIDETLTLHVLYKCSGIYGRVELRDLRLIHGKMSRSTLFLFEGIQFRLMSLNFFFVRAPDHQHKAENDRDSKAESALSLPGLHKINEHLFNRVLSTHDFFFTVMLRGLNAFLLFLDTAILLLNRRGNDINNLAYIIGSFNFGFINNALNVLCFGIVEIHVYVEIDFCTTVFAEHELTTRVCNNKVLTAIGTGDRSHIFPIPFLTRDFRNKSITCRKAKVNCNNMQKGGKTMDYWDYIAHSQGSERAGHRYYARELVGNKGGKNQYRYFYTAEEYSAYKNNKGTPGQGTYAETGKSRDALILPKGTLKARRRAETRESIAKQKREMDIERRNKWKRSVDHERANESVRKQKREMDIERRNKWKRSVDHKHANESVAAQKAEMDAKREQRQKRAENLEKRNKWKRSVDHKRANESVRKQKAEMDAKRARKQKRESTQAKRIGEQHSMDMKRYSKQRRAENLEKRNKWKRSVDRARTLESRNKWKRSVDHKRATENVRKQKAEMDAKRARRKRHQEAVERVKAQKHIMDNIRQRPYYKPTYKRYFR